MTRLALVTSLLVLGAGCSKGYDLLGDGKHDVDLLNLTVIAEAENGLNIPRDIAAHPVREGELWVVNRTESVLVIQDADDDPSFQFFGSTLGSSHFLAEPSAIACGMNGHCATAHETDKLTQGPVAQGGTPKDFMGPTLWPTDLDLFDAGHSSHYDMLHNSPLGMGMAWDSGNAYWMFDGFHNSITWYDFQHDHGPGGADHSDGIVRRYADGELKREADVPSHMELDQMSKLLYVNDTGNNRIVVLDTESGTEGANIPKNYDGGDQKFVDDADLDELVDGEDLGDDIFGREVPFDLEQPSGLALHNDHLFISDYEEGRIVVFDLDGVVVDWIDVGGTPTGLEFDAGGNLYFVDVEADELLRLSPSE